MKGILQATHPSSDQLYDLLTREEWEGLAVFSSEGIVTGLPDAITKSRFLGLGLIGPGERPTAAGYALLLTWLRRNPKQSLWRLVLHGMCQDIWSLLRGHGISDAPGQHEMHCNRMRLLLLGGAQSSWLEPHSN